MVNHGESSGHAMFSGTLKNWVAWASQLSVVLAISCNPENHGATMDVGDLHFYLGQVGDVHIREMGFIRYHF